MGTKCAVTVMLSIALISLLSFNAWMMDPQRGFYVAPRMGNIEIPVSNMQLVNKEEQQKKLGPQQYQQSPNKEQQGSKQDQAGSKQGDSGQKQEHMRKTTVVKSSTIKLKNNSEKRDEFVMKRGNPPLQLERICPRCPLNAACYTNASEFKNQKIYLKFITWEIARI